ncbi:hypothetical protein [Yoonia sp. 208BN28-4]|uniref:hypothetical protein n=1 Tax=Yoonia sp. 208BN28-4 TaxID=3126505 RepID=UPI0030B7321B
MRALLLFLIGLFLGGGIGLLAGGSLEMEGHAHDHSGHSDMDHDHSALTPWPTDTPAPDLSIALLEDGPTSRNLHIMADGFDWTPEAVNGPVTGGGHAHVYVNGEKVARAYGPWVHLTDFPTEGPVTVRVTLNANDHSGWSLDGVPLATETEFK